MRSFLFLIAATGLFGADDDASAKPKVVHRLPSLQSAFPQGARPGDHLTVDVLGQYLDRASAVIFSDDSITGRLVHVEPTRVQVDLTVAAGAFVGPRSFRVVSPRGASNMVMFRIGDQPHVREAEPNSTLEQAQAVTVPATINGQVNRDGDFDFFRFRAQAGETLIFDLRAARNGNGLDASMVLLDSERRRVEHDEDTFIWDPFFSHKFAASGDYTIAIQPTHARNDPGFAYQLDIRRSPHLETMSPLGIRPGVETEMTLFGRGLVNSGATIEFARDAAPAPGLVGKMIEARGDTALIRVRVDPSVAPGDYELRVGGAGLSNPAVFAVEPAPVHVSGQALQVPSAINGIAKYRQPEQFRFHAAKGRELVFEVRAKRYGSPADSLLHIRDAAGKVVATNDDGDFPGVSFNKDSRLRHKFEADGEYTLEMRNMYAVTGENYPYQLLVSEPKPAVELMLASDNPYLHAGKPAKIKVTAARRDGFDGEVPVRVEGLPAGFEAKPATIPAGKNEAEIEVTAPLAKPGDHAVFRVTGASGRDAETRPVVAWRSVRLSSGGGEGATFARTDRAVLAVAEAPLFSLECAATSVNLVRGGTAELKVMIRREPGFDGPITFRAENLPKGVELENPAAEASAELAVVRFKAAADAELGRAARVAIIGAGGSQTQEAPRVSILVD